MPSDAGRAAALCAPSRDAMASTRVDVPFCIAGITLFVAIRATPRTPQRTLRMPRLILILRLARVRS